MQDVFIEEALGIKKSPFYPKTFKLGKRCQKYLAVVGLGSNMGSEMQIFNKLAILLIKDSRLSLIESSPVLINKAFGYVYQKDFFNAVLLIQTSLHARAFLKLLLYYEFKFRRKRSFKNAPRTLDLDLLYFSKKSSNSSFCTLPHPGVSSRISVVLPLGMVI